jgi:hypothetical protein
MTTSSSPSKLPAVLLLSLVTLVCCTIVVWLAIARSQTASAAPPKPTTSSLAPIGSCAP